MPRKIDPPTTYKRGEKVHFLYPSAVVPVCVLNGVIRCAEWQGKGKRREEVYTIKFDSQVGLPAGCESLPEARRTKESGEAVVLIEFIQKAARYLN